MTRDSLPAPLGIVLFCLALAVLASRCGSHASAQSDEVLVARICESESGRDCAAIAHALVERAALRGVSVRAMAFAYAPRATGRRPYVGREYIGELHPDRLPNVAHGREALRVRFVALVVIAWHALRGITETPCPSAVHWGAPYCRACRERMREAGLVRVACDSSNDFFGVPTAVAPVLMCGAS